MDNLKWMKAIFLMEIKNMLSYRFEFWMKFLGQTALSFVVAFYLWQNIFVTNGVTQMGGYSFKGMMLYYLVAPLIFKIIDSDSMGLLSRDIYEGGLTKYLIYPVDFILYKLIIFYTHSLFYLFQLIFILLGFYFIWGIPPEFSLSFSHFLQTLPFIFLSTLLFFFFVASIEMIAFWADNTWSLMAMFHMTASFLGGTLVPLDFFPAWAQSILDVLPFKAMIYLPTQFLLGHFHELFFITALKLIFWISTMASINYWVYRKGLKQYTGVGI